MSIDRAICKKVQQRWADLGMQGSAPEALQFLKVPGKLSNTGAVVAMVFNASTQKPIAVAKIPRTPSVTTGIVREQKAMEIVKRDTSLWSGAKHIPVNSFIDEICGAQVLFQQAGKGHALVREMVGRENEEQIYEQILPWLLAFHNQTSTNVSLDEENLRRLVSDPIEQFLALTKDVDGITVPESVKQYLQQLSSLVEGKELKLCAQHGDFNAHNIVCTAIESGSMDFTVIDWEDHREAQLPIHDLNHFFISNSKLLDINSTASEAFSKHIIGAGWYQDLYATAVAKYEAAGIIDSETFYRLTPIYFCEYALRLMDEHRQQGGTINVWVDRLIQYIETFPLLPR